MSVTRPIAWKVPRSLSLVTTEGLMSTQIVLTFAGRRFPTAIECSIVHFISVMVTPPSFDRIIFCAVTTSVMTSGKGPSSRIEPARTK